MGSAAFIMAEVTGLSEDDLYRLAAGRGRARSERRPCATRGGFGSTSADIKSAIRLTNKHRKLLEADQDNFSAPNLAGLPSR